MTVVLPANALLLMVLAGVRPDGVSTVRALVRRLGAL